MQTRRMQVLNLAALQWRVLLRCRASWRRFVRACLCLSCISSAPPNGPTDVDIIFGYEAFFSDSQAAYLVRSLYSESRVLKHALNLGRASQGSSW